MTVSTIPTVSRAIEPPNPYKYWWLRSPHTDVSNNSCLVHPSGDVIVTYDGYFVDYSYGRVNSPVTNGSINAWDVTSYGGSFVDGVYNSYGNCFPLSGLELRSCVGRGVGWFSRQ